MRRKPSAVLHESGTEASGVTVRPRYRAPYDFSAMLSHLRDRAVDGVERVDGHAYVRTVLHDGQIGTVEVVHVPKAQSLAATIRFPSVRALPAIEKLVLSLPPIDPTPIGARVLAFKRPNS